MSDIETATLAEATDITSELNQTTRTGELRRIDGDVMIKAGSKKGYAIPSAPWVHVGPTGVEPC